MSGHPLCVHVIEEVKKDVWDGGNFSEIVGIIGAFKHNTKGRCKQKLFSLLYFLCIVFLFLHFFDV